MKILYRLFPVRWKVGSLLIRDEVIGNESSENRNSVRVPGGTRQKQHVKNSQFNKRNKSHTLAYSLVALQEMNLAYRAPVIYWNCACLISEAGGSDSEDSNTVDNDEIDTTAEITYTNEMEDFTENDNEDDVENEYDEDEDCDGYPVTVKVLKDGKKKKKAKSVNYGKVATAIGKITSEGVTVMPPDINKSGYTFTPDVKNNIIRYGLSGITRIGEDVVKAIMDNRPFISVGDFVDKVKVSKPQMVNLIKSGAFDAFGDRVDIMKAYVAAVSDTKKRVTLQNLKMLIDFGLIPDRYDLQQRVFYFNKYLKARALDETYYGLDNIALNFYSKHFDMDKLRLSMETESGFKIPKAAWDAYYKSSQDVLRPFIKANADKLLEAMNQRITGEMWNKYCKGNISKWEMDSVSFYSHEHELANVDMERYGLSDFSQLPNEPELENILTIRGKQIPIYRIRRICGTVLHRDKLKKSVTLLTTTGVVTIKIYGDAFANYDRRISERGADGVKHVIEESMFARGNKIIVTGVKDNEATFRAKKYKRTPYHLVEQITDINDDGSITTHNRFNEEEKA